MNTNKTLREEILKAKQISNLNPLRKETPVYNKICLTEAKIDPSTVSVYYPTFLNQYIKKIINKSKSGTYSKLDVTSVKNYYLYLCAISNYVNNKQFKLPIKSLAKVTYSGKRDINSHIACTNYFLYVMEFFNSCGLVKSVVINDDIHVLEIMVPENCSITEINQMQDFEISFSYENLNEKLEFMRALDLQAIDMSKVNVQLTAEQAAYIRSAIDSINSIADNVVVELGNDKDGVAVFSKKISEIFNQKFENAIIRKSDIDSSLFSRDSLL